MADPLVEGIRAGIGGFKDAISLESKIEKTYQSGTKWVKTIIEWPPRSVVNVIFVDDDLVVASVGII